ncbi:MAG: hypothetical protein HYV16_11210 [Gammaproteobacteria bacterium]|nr:hypothetical protein [Gammaproteobacteria bacterium]
MKNFMEGKMPQAGKFAKPASIMALAAGFSLGLAGCSSMPSASPGQGKIWVKVCNEKAEVEGAYDQTNGGKVVARLGIECKWQAQPQPVSPHSPENTSPIIELNSFWIQSRLIAGFAGGAGSGSGFGVLEIQTSLFKSSQSTGRGLYAKLGGGNITYKDGAGSGRIRVYHDGRLHQEIPLGYEVRSGELTVQNSPWLAAQVYMAMDTVKPARLEVELPNIAAQVVDPRGGQMFTPTLALSANGTALLAGSDAVVIEAVPDCGEYRCHAR